MTDAVAYYNEHDPHAAEWLRRLIAAGHIAPGDVDERSIEDVAADELVRYRQCHFFAGIGVWSYALRRAGWPDDREIWTGSCPCQPFSAAGEGAGFDDERHLWPAFFWLIEQRRPVVVVGEQVAARGALPWLDLVRTDLEAAAYTFGCVDTCAAGFGAPHIRQRLWWVARAAHSDRTGLPRQIQRISACPSDVTHAWRSIERIHAVGAWSTWVSESGTPALVDGASCRVGRLRAYGNAINAAQAEAFCAVVMREIA